jgi:hypothetical protein
MALFSKRKKPTTDGRSSVANLELIYENEASNRALAIGVRWKRIASSGGRQDAWRIAREAGASHAVFQGQQLGMGLLPATADRSTRVYPAALIAARHLGGNNLVALRIDEGFYWICETHSGQPTDIDEILRGADDASVLARLRELLDRNAALGAPVVVHTNIEDAGLPTRPLEMADLFGSVLTDADQITPLPKSAASIPKPLLAAIGVAILVLLAQHGLKKYDTWKRAKLLATNELAMADPVQAWSEAISNWESKVAAPDARGLMAVRTELDRLPVQWNGWRLERSECKAAGLNGASRTWSCIARYTRGTMGATNRQLAQDIPAHWSASWLPLGGLQLTWSVQQAAQKISIDKLKKPEFFNIEVASRIQEIEPAIGNDLVFSFAPIVIPAPKQNDGTVIPADARVGGLQSAALVVKAPLRSIDALVASDIEVDFKSMSITYAADTATDFKSMSLTDAAGVSGKIKASALQAEVKGDFYAKR